ncbi:MAG: GIY-YIG nuclease family protein [Candidatus Sericytochromatia bacterium]|nr:GIY-YIG nuclease family protein [Candidatus Sericytochromatia bacterium]
MTSCNHEKPHHFVYVLRCKDDSLYTGYTIDIARRLQEHQTGRGARYTRARRPVSLVTYWSFPTKHEAMSAEWAFKNLSRAQKMAQIAKKPCDEGPLI